MSDEYKAQVVALAKQYYAQGYPWFDAIRKAEAMLRLPALIEFARSLWHKLRYPAVIQLIYTYKLKKESRGKVLLFWDLQLYL